MTDAEQRALDWLATPEGRRLTSDQWQLETVLAAYAEHRDEALVRATAEECRPDRDGLHATYNGGWHGANENRAFHHGMDTVCNVVEGIDLPALLARVRARMEADDE